MKILFVSHTANFSKFNRPYMRYLKEKGWEVHYASAGEEPVKDCDRHFTIPLQRSPLSPKNFAALLELKKIIEHEKYDIIHSHTPTGGVIARLATMFRKNHHPKVIYTAHGFHFYKGGGLAGWLLFYPIEKLLSYFTDSIVLINREDYLLAKNKMHAKKTFQIPGVGVDATKFHPASQKQKALLRKSEEFKSDDILIICVGELNKNKNQEFIIQTLSKINNPKIHLLLAGVGDNRQSLQELASSLNMLDHVHFLGYRGDLDKLYQMSDIAISASIREGLGLGIIEAMACGLPLLCSNNRGHREIIENSKNGYLFELSDQQDLRKKLNKVVKSLPNFNPKPNALRAKKFSTDRSLEIMAKVYDV